MAEALRANIEWKSALCPCGPCVYHTIAEW